MSIASCSGTRCRVGQAGDGVDQMPERPIEALELPDDQGVAGAKLVQDLLEDGAVAAGARWRSVNTRWQPTRSRVDLELWMLVGVETRASPSRCPMPLTAQAAPSPRGEAAMAAGAGDPRSWTVMLAWPLVWPLVSFICAGQRLAN